MDKFTSGVKEVIKSIKGINLRNDTGVIRVRKYHDGVEENVGQGSTLSDALVKLKGDHWIDSSPTSGTFGFVYKIIDTKSDKEYIGRKQEVYYDKARGSYSIPTDWKTYKGSCKPLSSELNEREKDFLFVRLINCENREELGYAEHMLIRNTFNNPGKYWNKCVPKLFYSQVEGVTEEFKEAVHGIADGI